MFILFTLFLPLSFQSTYPHLTQLKCSQNFIHNYVQHLVTSQASTTVSRPSHLLHSVIMVEVYLEALFPGAEGRGVSGGGKGGRGAVLEFSVEPLVF